MTTQHCSRFVRIKLGLAAVVSSSLLMGCALCRADKNEQQILEDVQWAVSEINGEAVLAGSKVTMQFDPVGRVSGKASCNGYSASYQRDGNSLQVSSLISTKRLCMSPDGLMAQEQRFSDLLQQVVSWQIEEQGQLVLSTQNGNTLVAQSMAE